MPIKIFPFEFTHFPHAKNVGLFHHNHLWLMLKEKRLLNLHCDCERWNNGVKLMVDNINKGTLDASLAPYR